MPARRANNERPSCRPAFLPGRAVYFVAYFEESILVLKIAVVPSLSIE